MILCATSWDSCLCSSLTMYNDNNVPPADSRLNTLPHYQPRERILTRPEPRALNLLDSATGCSHDIHTGVCNCRTHSGVIKTGLIRNTSVIIQTRSHFCFLVMRLAPCTAETSHQECHSHLFPPLLTAHVQVCNCRTKVHLKLQNPNKEVPSDL